MGRLEGTCLELRACRASGAAAKDSPWLGGLVRQTRALTWGAPGSPRRQRTPGPPTPLTCLAPLGSEEVGPVLRLRSQTGAAHAGPASQKCHRHEDTSPARLSAGYKRGQDSPRRSLCPLKPHSGHAGPR